jgi:hypothetical protein
MALHLNLLADKKEGVYSGNATAFIALFLT